MDTGAFLSFVFSARLFLCRQKALASVRKRTRAYPYRAFRAFCCYHGSSYYQRYPRHTLWKRVYMAGPFFCSHASGEFALFAFWTRRRRPPLFSFGCVGGLVLLTLGYLTV